MSDLSEILSKLIGSLSLEDVQKMSCLTSQNICIIGKSSGSNQLNQIVDSEVG